MNSSAINAAFAASIWTGIHCMHICMMGMAYAGIMTAKRIYARSMRTDL